MTAPKFEDVMLDIETLSLHPSNALILSIGLTEFNAADPAGPVIRDHRLLLPSIMEQIINCRHIDPKTQRWWSQQPIEAREHWADVSETQKAPIRNVSYVIHDFCRGKRVWANGAAFDLSNVHTLVWSKGIEDPWHYQAARDMRTFCRQNPQSRRNLTLEEERKLLPENFDMISHHPLADNAMQIARVWEHWPRELPLEHHPV